ncbi:hypothetical protein, partial [Halostagnicola sp. A-GB9-2]|uniref:hypothetical protein n=1 Tax=Halostagnicola sp. A-GB9-2 TaxID=3048066 RepID=UPI0031F30869
ISYIRCRLALDSISRPARLLFSHSCSARYFQILLISRYRGTLACFQQVEHSLLILGPIVIIGYLLARYYNHPEYGIAFGIGSFSHSLVDALPALWAGTVPNSLLWPVLPVEGYGSAGAPTVTGLLMDSLGSLTLLTEFVLAGLALLCWRCDRYPGLELLRVLINRLMTQSAN